MTAPSPSQLREALAKLAHENGPIVIDHYGDGLAWRPIDHGTWTPLALEAQRETGGDDDCDLCFGIMSRACPRCNPIAAAAMERQPTPAADGEDLRAAALQDRAGAQAVLYACNNIMATVLASSAPDGGPNDHSAKLDRICAKVEAIRAKQAAKPKHSPLPQATPPASVSGEVVVPRSVLEWATHILLETGEEGQLLAEIRQLLAAAPEAATPSAVGGVDRMREVLEPFTRQHIHKNEPGSSGILVPATVADVRRAKDALTTGETSPERDRLREALRKMRAQAGLNVATNQGHAELAAEVDALLHSERGHE